MNRIIYKENLHVVIQAFQTLKSIVYFSNFKTKTMLVENGLFEYIRRIFMIRILDLPK